MIDVVGMTIKHHKLKNRELHTALVIVGVAKTSGQSSGYATGLWIGWKPGIHVIVFKFMTMYDMIVQSNLDYPNLFGQGEISNRSDKQGVGITRTTPIKATPTKSIMHTVYILITVPP